MRNRILRSWLCWGVLLLWCGEYVAYAEKQADKGENEKRLLLLLKKLDEKLERMTSKMSRIEGRLSVLEANQKKQQTQMELQISALKGAMEKKAAEQAAAMEKRTTEQTSGLKRLIEQKTAENAQVLRKQQAEFERQGMVFQKGLAGLKKEGLRWKEELLAEGRKWWGGSYLFQAEQLRQKDWGKASAWYEKACQLGNKEACRRKMPSAGYKRVVSGLNIAVRWIPAGEFRMGSGESDSPKDKDEQPQHSVRISRGFWMMETEVTQGQWKAWMRSNPSYFKNCGDMCPVEQVRWHEAALYANKLSEREGKESCFSCWGSGDSLRCEGKGNKTADYVGCKGWRLPTEAEWEYAARAGTTTPHYGELNRVAWYVRNSGLKTHPVGRKEANAWGLYDTLGNVWEWVYDSYNGTAYKERGKAVTDPVQAPIGTSRVLRGGGWYDGAYYVRAAERHYLTLTLRYRNLGFRVVRSSH